MMTLSVFTERLVLDLVSAWNSHDMEQVAAFYTPEYEGVDIAQAAPHRGMDGLRRNFSRVLTAFPDMQFQVEQIIIQDRTAALLWQARGTHRGAFLEIPPTHRAVAVRGVTLLAVEQGRIHRAQYIWDMAGLLRAMGLLPKL